MVELAKIPRRLALTEDPKSSLSRGDISSPYNSLAQGLSEVGEGLEAIAVPAATEAGFKAVTQDADGNLQVQRAPIVGKAGAAFNHAVKTAALANGETMADEALLNLRHEFRTNPEGFKAAAKAFRDEKVGQYNESGAGAAVGFALGKSIDGTATRYYAGLRNEKENLEIKRSNESIDARITTLGDDMETLARKNGIGPEYQEKLADFDALLKAKVNNPLLAFPQEKADALRANLITRVQGAAVLEQVEHKYRTEGFDAARTYLRESVKGIEGKVKQTDKIERAGLSWLRTEEAGYRGERMMIAQEWATAKPVIEQLPPATVQDMANRAYAVGAHRVGRDIETHAQALQIAAEFRALPRAEQARAVATGKASLVDRIVGAESGGDPNAAATTSSALGLGQFTKGTWLDVVKKRMPAVAQGKSDEEILALRRDPNVSREAIAQYSEQNKQTLAAAGVRTDDSALYLAHFLGPGDAVKVLQADPGAPLAGVVQPASIAANKGIFDRNPTAGQLQTWAAGKVGAGAVDLTQSRSGMMALGMIKKGLAADLPKRITDLKAAVGKQEFPAIEEVDALGAEVALLGTPEQKQEVAGLAAIAQYGRGFAQLPAPQRQAILSEWENRIAAGAPKLERDLVDNLRSADKSIDEAYKKDPYGAFYRFAEGSKPTRAVDFINPEDASAVLRERVVQQSQIKAYERRDSFSALRPDEARGVAASLTQGDPKAAAGVLDTLAATLPNDIYRETMTDKPMKDALDGMARSYDPVRMNAAFSTLDRMWRTDPVGFSSDFGAETLKRLQTWQAWKDTAGPAEIAERFKRADDPAFAAARKTLGEEAEKELKAWKPHDIAQSMRSWLHIPFTGIEPGDGLQAAGLKAEFDQNYKDLRGNGVEPGMAATQASERLKTVWGVSVAAGGNLMRLPPEKYYPQVDGSHAWMAAPLEADIAKAVGQPRVSVTGPVVREMWTHNLVADAITGADISAGRPPSYQVFVTDTRTGRINAPRDAAGNLMRYRWDAAPLQEKARDQFMEQRAAQAPLVETTTQGAP